MYKLFHTMVQYIQMYIVHKIDIMYFSINMVLISRSVLKLIFELEWDIAHDPHAKFNIWFRRLMVTKVYFMTNDATCIALCVCSICSDSSSDIDKEMSIIRTRTTPIYYGGHASC